MHSTAFPTTFVNLPHQIDGNFVKELSMEGEVREAVLRKYDELREDFKYYFADFVRKGGTPPPFTDKIFSKKKVTDLGGTPPQWVNPGSFN